MRYAAPPDVFGNFLLPIYRITLILLQANLVVALRTAMPAHVPLPHGKQGAVRLLKRVLVGPEKSFVLSRGLIGAYSGIMVQELT